jgi:hypothetical protein
VGRLEGWKVGKLEGWKVEKLEGWKVGGWRFILGVELICPKIFKLIQFPFTLL